MKLHRVGLLGIGIVRRNVNCRLTVANQFSHPFDRAYCRHVVIGKCARPGVSRSQIRGCENGILGTTRPSTNESSNSIPQFSLTGLALCKMYSQFPCFFRIPPWAVCGPVTQRYVVKHIMSSVV